jgi:hypothetical protein
MKATGRLRPQRVITGRQSPAAGRGRARRGRTIFPSGMSGPSVASVTPGPAAEGPGAGRQARTPAGTAGGHDAARGVCNGLSCAFALLTAGIPRRAGGRADPRRAAAGRPDRRSGHVPAVAGTWRRSDARGPPRHRSDQPARRSTHLSCAFGRRGPDSGRRRPFCATRPSIRVLRRRSRKVCRRCRRGRTAGRRVRCAPLVRRPSSSLSSAAGTRSTHSRVTRDHGATRTVKKDFT